MLLMCRRLLPEAERRVDIYLQGTSSFKLPKGYFTVKVYCSEHNAGARELAEELNTIWPGLLQIANVQSWSDVGACDHMLVYLNALTWTHDPETFAAEIREAMRQGLHLQPCHEFPSVIDLGSERQALEFKQIMDATPADLKNWPTNVYSQIAIALKGGELREPGLANLATRLAVRVPRNPIDTPQLLRSGQRQPSTVKHLIFQSARNLVQKVETIRPRSLVTTNSDVAVGAQHPGCTRSTRRSSLSTARSPRKRSFVPFAKIVSKAAVRSTKEDARRIFGSKKQLVAGPREANVGSIQPGGASERRTSTGRGNSVLFPYCGRIIDRSLRHSNASSLSAQAPPAQGDPPTTGMSRTPQATANCCAHSGTAAGAKQRDSCDSMAMEQDDARGVFAQSSI